MKPQDSIVRQQSANGYVIRLEKIKPYSKTQNMYRPIRDKYDNEFVFGCSSDLFYTRTNG